MEVDAFLADSAESVQGKIYALGIGWNTIFCPSFPVVHARVAIGITVRVPYTATNQMHTISAHLETEDALRVQLGLSQGAADLDPTPVLELKAQFNVGRPPLLPAGDEQIVAFAMEVNQLPFESPGMFSWVISIDGVEVKRLPMRVHQLAPGQLG